MEIIVFPMIFKVTLLLLVKYYNYYDNRVISSLGASLSSFE